MGTIYASQLAARIPRALVQAHVGPSAVSSPSAVQQLTEPAGPDADSALEVLVSRTLRRQPGAAAAVMARVRADLSLPAAWGLINVNVREKALGTPTRQTAVEDRLRVPHGVLTSFFDEIAAGGYLTRTGDQLELTERGARAVTAVVDAWTAWLSEQLSGSAEPAGLDDRVRAALRRIARRLLVEEARGPELPEAAPATASY